MRTYKNTEPRRDIEYRCFDDAVTSLLWMVPLSLALVFTNPVWLVLVGVVVFFSWKICGAD